MRVAEQDSFLKKKHHNKSRLSTRGKFLKGIGFITFWSFKMFQEWVELEWFKRSDKVNKTEKAFSLIGCAKSEKSYRQYRLLSKC